MWSCSQVLPDLPTDYTILYLAFIYLNVFVGIACDGEADEGMLVL